MLTAVLVDALAGRARAFDGIGDRVMALRDWDRALGSADAKRVMTIALGRARSLALAGEITRALDETTSRLADPGVTSDNFVQAARIYAIAGARGANESAELRRGRTARALALLESAAKRGRLKKSGARRIESDPDFAELRTLPAFRLVISDLAFPDDPFGR